MLRQIKHIDRLLRGDATQLSALRYGSVALPVRESIIAIALMGAIYGICMTTYTLTGGGDMPFARVFVTMVKVPTLFLLTLTITFPSLYAFNALVGSPLSIQAVWRLLIATLVVMTAVLASLGPITAFFSLSTDSYPFMLMLNVAIFTIAGVLGLRFLLRTLERIHQAAKEGTGDEENEEEIVTGDNGEHVAEPLSNGSTTAATTTATDADIAQLVLAKRAIRPGPLDRRSKKPTDPKVRRIFRTWVVVFGLVGAQLSWVMSPFVGDPDRPFMWYHGRESSFFEAVWKAFLMLMS